MADQTPLFDSTLREFSRPRQWRLGFHMRPGIRLLTAPETSRYAATAAGTERHALIESLHPSLLCGVCGQLAAGHLIVNGARSGERHYKYEPPVLLSVCAGCFQHDQPAVHRLVQHYFPFAVGIQLNCKE